MTLQKSDRLLWYLLHNTNFKNVVCIQISVSTDDRIKVIHQI